VFGKNNYTGVGDKKEIISASFSQKINTAKKSHNHQDVQNDFLLQVEKMHLHNQQSGWRNLRKVTSLGRSRQLLERMGRRSHPLSMKLALRTLSTPFEQSALAERYLHELNYPNPFRSRIRELLVSA
jgi:hypothetical protein